jgi:hypothetical protein
MKIAVPLAEDNENVEATNLRWQVRYLTNGEAQYYVDHPGAAYAVLRELAIRIYLKEIPLRQDPLPGRTAKKADYNFSVYGLTESQLEYIAYRPHAATRALAEYARARDDARIEKIDKGWAEAA